MGIDVTDEIRKDVNEMCNYGDYLYSKGEMKGEMETYFLLVQDGDIVLSGGIGSFVIGKVFGGKKR